MEENNCNRGAQSRLPLVGPGDQNLIRKETLAAGSLRSRPPGSFFNEKMLCVGAPPTQGCSADLEYLCSNLVLVQQPGLWLLWSGRPLGWWPLERFRFGSSLSRLA